MKKILKKIIPKKIYKKMGYSIKNVNKIYPNISKIKKYILAFFKFFSLKMFSGEDAHRKALEHCKIKLSYNNHFVYSIDESIFIMERPIISNTTIDYSQFLNISLNELIEKFKNENDEYSKYEYEFLLIMKKFLDKIIISIKKTNLNNQKRILNNLQSIYNDTPSDLYQAMQKLLFLNNIAWQIGMPLNGFGRLDKILSKYKYDTESVDKLIYDFLDIAHCNYYYKSNVLLGDTGQIIILGGLEENGTYFSNELTYKFIEQLQKLKRPDPKILLRVSSLMDKNLLKTAVNCIKTGIGSPLLSNDDVIISKLIDFGYKKEDAYNYVTSACWEPLICGKSLDQNNIKTINFAIPFLTLLEKEDLKKMSYQDILKKYKFYLKKYIEKIVEELNKIKFSKNPLLTLFTKNCNVKKMDISKGSAEYNNFGLTSVGLSTIINSLLNIKRICFDLKLMNLNDLNKYRLENWKDEKILKLLKSSNKKFGLDDKEVIQLTNTIIDFTNEELLKYTNNLNGKLKFGLSAPGYIDEAKNIDATLDGRKNNEAFSVHISSDYSFDETIFFSSKLHYDKCSFNGNVVDFILTPDYIENNFDKFIDFLFIAIKNGFFQMQMNVISSKQLIEAKKNPSLYPNLIVRVWGFSAYFNELPNEYKDILIERALKNETR